MTADCCNAAATVVARHPDWKSELEFCNHHARVLILSGVFDDGEIEFSEQAILYFKEFFDTSLAEFFDKEQEQRNDSTNS